MLPQVILKDLLSKEEVEEIREAIGPLLTESGDLGSAR